MLYFLILVKKNKVDICFDDLFVITLHMPASYLTLIVFVFKITVNTKILSDQESLDRTGSPQPCAVFRIFRSEELLGLWSFD